MALAWHRGLYRRRRAAQTSRVALDVVVAADGVAGSTRAARARRLVRRLRRGPLCPRASISSPGRSSREARSTAPGKSRCISWACATSGRSTPPVAGSGALGLRIDAGQIPSPIGLGMLENRAGSQSGDLAAFGVLPAGCRGVDSRRSRGRCFSSPAPIRSARRSRSPAASWDARGGVHRQLAGARPVVFRRRQSAAYGELGGGVRRDAARRVAAWRRGRARAVRIGDRDSRIAARGRSRRDDGAARRRVVVRLHASGRRAGAQRRWRRRAPTRTHRRGWIEVTQTLTRACLSPRAATRSASIPAARPATRFADLPTLRNGRRRASDTRISRCAPATWSARATSCSTGTTSWSPRWSGRRKIF